MATSHEASEHSQPSTRLRELWDNNALSILGAFRASLPSTQIDEHRDLLAHDFGVEWFHQVVGPAGRIGSMNLFRIVAEGSHENDGNVTSPIEFLEVHGHLEPGHVRHGDVDQRDGEAL